MIVDLTNGVPAGGVVRLIEFLGFSANSQPMASTIGTLLLLLLGFGMGLRAFIWNRVCIGNNCSIK